MRAALAAIPSSSGNYATVHFVHFGTLLSTRVFPAPTSLQALCSTRGLKLDLEQAQPIEDEAYQARLQAVVRACSGEIQPTLQGTPVYADVVSSFVPEDPDLIARFNEHGCLEELRHRQVEGLVLQLDYKFRYSRLDSWARDGCTFSSPERSWPARSPSFSPAGWLAWLRGAILCLARRGRVAFTQASLRGNLRCETDGVRAEFHGDGTLQRLACYRQGRPLGWILDLAPDRNAGQVHHAQAEFCESFDSGHSCQGEERQPACWSSWAELWIEAVYRDAQSPD